MMAKILAFIVVLILIAIIYMSFGAGSPASGWFGAKPSIAHFENMITSYEGNIQYLLQEVNYENARVEQCLGCLGVTIEPGLGGIIQPQPNDMDIAGMQALLADKINHLVDLRRMLADARAQYEEINSLLSIATYNYTPAAALKLENDLGSIAHQISQIKIEIERTKARVKTAEDMTMIHESAIVPYNHYNAYRNNCIHMI